jgi:hypothetical protein
MNKLPFLEKSNFPVDTTALNELQKISTEELQNAIVALTGEQNGILKGVANNGGAYSDGIVIVGGEILPFVASSGYYLTVIEEIDTATAYGETYNVLKRRYARATAQNTGKVMDNFKTINLSVKASIPKYEGAHYYIGRDTAYMTSQDARLSYAQTDSGFSVIKGRFTLKPNTYNTAGWYTIFSLTGYTGLIPRTPHNALDTYFNLYYDDYEAGSFNVKIGRITGAGDFQLYFPTPLTIAANKNVYVNINYYNPTT